MSEKPHERKPGRPEKPVSLHPIPFEEAVADLLKVKPPKKPEKTKDRESK